MPSEPRSKKAPSVFFIVPAPLGISPGQRFRFEHYLPHLGEHGIRYRIGTFYSLRGWKTLYLHGNRIRKFLIVLGGLLKRWGQVFAAARYDFVYVYREAAPVGPPFFEWLLSRVFRKKIIYDFDDAIWIPVTSEYNRTAARLKSFSKVGKICRWSHIVSVGNDFLATYARQFNKQVVVIPTVVETNEVHNRIQQQDTSQPAIGWTGTFSTLPYLDIVLPALQELQQQFDFSFVVIADKDPALPLKNYRFIRWSREKEVDDLLAFHIGLMPLHDDEISKGKCGFKAIQYMSLGIPAVVSPVGVNAVIVDDAVNGYVVDDKSGWTDRLGKLLRDANLRGSMGAAARDKIVRSYSVDATLALFIGLFRKNGK